MPFDGNGTFTPLSPPTFPAVSGTVISAAYFNSVINDLINNGFNKCLTRDNQGKPSATMNFNGQDLTNVKDLAVTGNSSLTGTLSVTGAVTFAATLKVGDSLGVGYSGTFYSAGAFGVNIRSREAVPSANSALWVTTTPNDGGTVNTLLRVQNNGSTLLGTDTELSGSGSSGGIGIRFIKTGALVTHTLNETNQYSAKIAGYGDSFFHRYFVAGAAVGSVTTTGVATSFNTTSDYRLKFHLQPISGALEKVKNLPAYIHSWNPDGSGQLSHGFLAHEAAMAVPEAVTGEKDAVDAQGNIVPQQVDYSKFVPLLVAALQEAAAKIEVLETKIATLEAL